MRDYGVHRPGHIGSIADGWSQLAMSVILQARKDNSKDTLKICDECGLRNWACVSEFYDSTWFSYLCELARVDPERTRALL